MVAGVNGLQGRTGVPDIMSPEIRIGVSAGVTSFREVGRDRPVGGNAGCEGRRPWIFAICRILEHAIRQIFGHSTDNLLQDKGQPCAWEGAPMKPQVVCALVALTLATIFTGAAYAEYPQRNVTVVVPFPPGGASDVTARLTGNKLAERLGKSVVIENRAGANGGLGTTGVKSAVPDGYTLLIGSIGVYAINPVLYKNLKSDPLKDFDLLSLLVRTPNVLVTSPNFPVTSAGDLIAHLKKNPNQLTFASSGIGSSDHLTAVLFWQNTGTSGVHVPYKG